MLLSCGDALIDFLPVKSVDGRDAIVPVAGRSCLNIAVGMARLGEPACTAFKPVTSGESDARKQKDRPKAVF